uniref:BLOC-1-related complex subunit 7 n=1 Tax=Timema genevievae TaxID=629358 RepID=A0A7R9JTR3_TIMGE|nr:unnamed protein product [Timema genevievae]
MPHFPFLYNVSHCLSTRSNSHLKVDKVLKGTTAWDNVDLIEEHTTLHAHTRTPVLDTLRNAKLENKDVDCVRLCSDGCPEQNKDSTVTELTSYKLGSEVPVHDEVKPTGQWHFKMSLCKRLILTKNTNGSVKVQGEVHYICDCGVPGSIIKKGKCLSIMTPVQLNNMVPVKRAKLNYVANLIAKHFGANWREREDLAYYSKILMHAARNFALQEHAINNSESNLKKLQLISAHLGYQQESLMKSSLLVEEVKEQVRAMQR